LTLDAPYRSGPSRTRIKVKNPKAPALLAPLMGRSRGSEKNPPAKVWSFPQGVLPAGRRTENEEVMKG
jgi:hypothetical protein